MFVLGYLNSSIDSENRITFNRLLKQSSEEFWLAGKYFLKSDVTLFYLAEGAYSLTTS